ncbi:MAG: hypothetical protein ICV71_03005 [Thermoleophilia bacterium]|nr:hypothetical protein [Thermoleophilia bacterium]
MFEREKTDIDSIEFDFFDDSPTTETTREEEAPRRRRRIPTRPPRGAGTPLVRLAALIGAAIVLAVVLILWVSSCRADEKKDAYADYMTDAGKVAGRSEAVGRDLNELIFSAGIQVKDLQAQLEGLRQRQSQITRQALELDPPGRLRDQNESFVEAMQLRESGLNGLGLAFSRLSELGGGASSGAAGGSGATGSGNAAGSAPAAGEGAAGASGAGSELARQANRLVASDVVYEDLFLDPSKQAMTRDGVTDVVVPESTFVQNVELASPNSWKLIVERLTKPPTAGGLHGNKLAGVRALPEGKQLSATEENTVKASDKLALEILVNNSGDNQETQVKVNLTIQQSPEPIRLESTIDAINPGETKSVVFRDIGAVSFGSRTIVKATVEPVAREENTNNNTAEYVVYWTFAG